jgi:hypothetical protein
VRHRRSPLTLNSVFVLALWSGMALLQQQCTPDMTNTSYELEWDELDFVPDDDNYDINWPGPPRRKLRYSDVEKYWPILTLKHAVPTDVRLHFWIKADRTAWPDPTLGSFYADYSAGFRIPLLEVHYPNAVGDAVAPLNAPSSGETRALFWLGCTQAGKVKGNEGRDDDGHARVYLEMFRELVPTGYSLAGDPDNDDLWQSGRHTVECK